MVISQNLLAQLRHEEGNPKRPGAPVLHTYQCPAGHWTIGYGHNLEAHPDSRFPPRAGVTCTPNQAERWLIADVMSAEHAMLIRWPWMRQLPPRVYDACIDLTYNMGAAKVAEFVHFLTALRACNYAAAAAELEDSLWYRQVGNRAPNLVSQVRRGV